MKYLKIKNGLEIHYDGDLPARSGLGSSSAFTVGLLHCLKTLSNEKVSKNIKFEGKNIRSPFGGGNAQFYAQGDYQADLILPAYFHLSDGKYRYYSLDAQEDFLEHLSKVTETIDRSLEENKKADDLLNWIFVKNQITVLFKSVTVE